MKIGIFTESFLPQVNGVVTAICSSAEVLSKRHDIEIFTVGEGPGSASGCPVHRFRGIKLPTYPDYRFFVPSSTMWKRLSGVELDIIHVRSSVPFGLIALRLAKKKGIPMIGTFDTPISDYVHYVPILGKVKAAKKMLSRTALKYMIWFYNRCEVVIAPSKVAAKWLREMGCKSKIIALSNGVDTKKFRPGKADSALKRRLSPDGPMLFHAGRITKEKSVHVLLEAARTLKDRGFKSTMVIAGKGPAFSDAKRRVHELGIEDCVKLLGFVKDGDLQKYYASSDVFVTASEVETEGIVLLEAMASGLPAIGPKAGAIPEIVRDGSNGLLFSPGNARNLADAIMSASVKPRMKSLSRGALATSKRYSILKMASRLEGIYEGIAKH